MAASLMLALLGAVEVLGQATHNTAAFSYQACSNIDVARFGAPLSFPDGRVTPEACQTLCQGHQYAALMPNACRCGDDASAVNPIDESKCDFACMGDRNLGMCGSVCPDNSPKIANIYARAAAQPAATSPGSGGISQYQSAPVSSDASCTSQAAGSAQPTGAPRITPPGAPGPDGKPPGPSLPQLPSPLSGAPSSSCTSGATSNSATPAPTVGSPHDLPTNAPQPSAYPRPTEPAPATPSAEAPAVSSPQPYAGSQSPSGAPGQLPSATINGIPVGGSQMSPVVSETTLWPTTSASRSNGMLPAPSQVPGSDSHHDFTPPLVQMGGLALVVAVFM